MKNSLIRRENIKAVTLLRKANFSISLVCITTFIFVASTFSQNTAKISYLSDIVSGLPDGVERDFLLALEKRESEHLDLIEAFNLLGYKDLQPFVAIQLPGKEAEPAHIDLGGTWAMTNRPKLRWEKALTDTNDSFRLLFFQIAPPTRIRPTCDAIIVITDTNYKIRFWSATGCYEKFIKAEIAKVEDGFIFAVFSKVYQEEKIVIKRYKITLNKIASLT